MKIYGNIYYFHGLEAHTAQSDLQILWNPYQNNNALFIKLAKIS
jgi:hypothetical protein